MYTAIIANSNPAGSPIASIRRHSGNFGDHNATLKCRYESFLRKYVVNHNTATMIDTSVEMAAPATPSGCPVPHPKIRNGARIMLMMMLAVDTIIPGLKLPAARSAAPNATSRNCNASAGMNHSRYELANCAVTASAPMTDEYHFRRTSPTIRNTTPVTIASTCDWLNRNVAAV